MSLFSASSSKQRPTILTQDESTVHSPADNNDDKSSAVKEAMQLFVEPGDMPQELAAKFIGC